MILRKFIVFVIIFSSFAIANERVFAQGIADINVTDIFIKTDPEIPEANSSLTVSVSSFLVNLENSKIEWLVDGKTQRDGIGLKSFTITTGDVGKKQTVTAIITDLTKGYRFEKNITIEPSTLDLLWQVKDGYVNGFYKGKNIPSREATIKLVAIPNRKNQTTASQKNLTYAWKRNFDNIPSASGFGKQSFQFKNDYLKEVEKVDVTVREGNTTYVSSQKVDLTFYNPIILFYQKKDGVGVDFWNALNDGLSIGTQDFSLIAEQFFKTPKDKNGPTLKYVWKVNNTTIQTPDYKSYITVRSDGGNGTSTIDLEIENISRLFQQARRVLNISVFSN